MTVSPAWIAVDWGTSNLRVWAMDDADKVLAEERSEQGMNAVKPGDFPAILSALLGDWDVLDGPIVCCGMIGARQGWTEAPYREVRCPPLASDTLVRGQSAQGLSVWIVPGLCQREPGYDVMRGEETQIAGFIAKNPGWSGFLCMPGTHTKWVRVHEGQVLWFHTYMSGEIFSLLSCQSVLRHSVNQQWDEDAFRHTVADIIAERQSTGFFDIRTSQLLGATGLDSGRARLSAKIIGAEIVTHKTDLTQNPVAVIGSGQMAQAYKTAIGLLSEDVALFDETPLTLAGLAMARRGLLETTP